MAFMRYANAKVLHPSVSARGWGRVRTAAKRGNDSLPAKNLVAQATEILGEPFSPENYLLTHCFPAGHMVLMADGTEKAIEDIEVGDLVITHKGNVKPVTTLLRKQVDEDLVVIKAASVPEVACTGEHPFYVIREDEAWCRVYPSYQGEVKCTFGGKQVCEKHFCLTNGAVPDWVDARDVRVGDRTYTPTLHRTQVSTDLNPNRMRVLGYYAAEGRVDKDHDGRLHSIRFSIHEDEVPTLGAEIARLMRMEFGVSTHSVIRDRKRDTKCVTLAFHSHEHAPWFLRHAGCGSRTKRLSPDVVWSPVDWQRQLVGAWINGDGCYDGQRDSGNNGIRLSTSSDDLASQAVVLLDRMGVHSRLQRVQTQGRKYRGRWIKGTDGWHVEVSASYLPKLADVVRWDVVGTASKRLSTKGRYRYAASTLSTVKSVERRHYTGTVYNLSVQDDESYIVNRQAVHNCTIVASVDVEQATTKVGKFRVGSKTHERKWADYLITPETSQYVNNNGDSWARETLLKSFHTFVGAHNFLEHVQIEEHSKGRIIDAVARDIGDSIYIDILVATSRKHAALVKKIENDELTTLSMGCFLPGTMVSMADGTRIPIEEVQPGDMVLTHKGRAREVLNKQIRGGAWDIRRIRAQGVPNEIAATDIHPFFVFRGAETCACGCGEELPGYTPRPGNHHTTRRLSRRFKRGHDKRILNPNGSYSLEEYRERRARLDEIMQPKMEEVKASDLKVGDFLCFPRAEVASLDGGATAGRARLLGYFLAEGSFLKYKGEPTEVQFNFSMGEKETFVAEVVELLRTEFPEANDPWVQDRPERNICVVHIHGREVAQWFYRHGGEYSHQKKLSSTAMQWPIELHKHVVGAWINGGGYLHKIHGHTSGTTTSYNLACQMHMLLAQCGVYARMECNIAGRSVDVREVVNGGVVIRDDDTGKLPAFNLVAGQAASQLLRGYCDKVISDPTFENTHFRCLDDVVMFPITSITPDTYEGWVHDMEVEEDHSYTVEGVAVHNCSVDFTICSKCGNVAVDEVDLCDHIRYSKLNRFIDEDGKQRIIAELCGHPTIEPTGGVTFIEASWVETPAFTGAKMRNRIEVKDISDRMAAQAEAVLNSPPPEWTMAGVQKAASSTNLPAEQPVHLAFNFGPDEEGGGDAPASPSESKGPLDELEDEIVQEVVDSAGKRLKDEIRDKQDADGGTETSDHMNDTIIKESHQAAVTILARTASTHRELVSGLSELDRAFGSSLPEELYSAALRVGPSSRYPNLTAFLGACRQSLGRKPTPSEAKGILRVGRCLAMVGRNHHEAGA